MLQVAINSSGYLQKAPGPPYLVNMLSSTQFMYICASIRPNGVCKFFYSCEAFCACYLVYLIQGLLYRMPTHFTCHFEDGDFVDDVACAATILLCPLLHWQKALLSLIASL